MLFAKFSTAILGSFWLQIDLQDNRQAEERARGIAEGWGLCREDRFELVDIRFSKHPVEPLHKLDEIREFIKQMKEN